MITFIEEMRALLGICAVLGILGVTLGSLYKPPVYTEHYCCQQGYDAWIETTIPANIFRILKDLNTTELVTTDTEERFGDLTAFSNIVCLSFESSMTPHDLETTRYELEENYRLAKEWEIPVRAGICSW